MLYVGIKIDINCLSINWAKRLTEISMKKNIKRIAKGTSHELKIFTMKGLCDLRIP